MANDEIKIVKYLFPKILNGYTIEDGKWNYTIKKNGSFLITVNFPLSFSSLAENKYIFDLKRKNTVDVRAPVLSDTNFSFHLENISNNVFTKRNSPYKVEIIYTPPIEPKLTEKTKYLNFQPFEEYLYKEPAKKEKTPFNVEFEIKLGCPSRTLFFKTLYKLYEKYSSFYSFEKSTVSYGESRSEDIRQIKTGNTITTENKETLKFTKGDVKISLSKEKVNETASRFTERFKRVRNRHSFIGFYPNFKKIKIDVTEIIFPVEAYEIEIDYTFDPLLEKPETIKENLLKLDETYFDLFRIMNETEVFFTNKEKQEVIDEFLKNKASSIPALKHPVDLPIEELVLYGRKIEKEYVYSYKANGKPAILKFAGDGHYLYLFFVAEGGVITSFKKIHYPISSSTDFNSEIYYLGEEIPYENRLDDVSKYPLLFVIFDCIDFKNINSTYKERYNRYCKRISETSGTFGSNLKIITKDIFPLNLDTFYKDEISTGDKIAALPFKTDGFILTPISSNEKKVYKIKPFDELGIDFEVDFEGKNLLYGKKEIFTENYTIDWDEIRMAIERNNKWIFNLSFNPIVEMLPSKTKGSETGIIHLSFGRLRNLDKVVPNGKFTVINVWREITSDKSIYDYLNLDKGILRMRKLHNMIKSILLNDINAVEKPFNIIDIGSGFGGDLSKFANIPFRKILLIEPDREHLNELERRLKTNYKMNQRINDITILNTGGEDKELILRNSSSFIGKNVVTSMLSLTFLFNPELYPAFVDVLNSIPNKDSFYFFCFDKTKTIENLKIYGTEKKSQLYIFEENKYKVIYDKKEDKVFINIDDTIVENQTEYLVDIEKLAADTVASEVFVNSSSLILDKKFPYAFLSKAEIILNNFYIFGKFTFPSSSEGGTVTAPVKKSEHLFFDEQSNTGLPKMFIDYMFQIKDFYKEKFREFSLDRNELRVSPRKLNSETTANNIKDTLTTVKKNFPFKNPFYEYNDYVNTKAIKKLLPPSAYKQQCFPVIITKAFLKFNEILHNYEKEIFEDSRNVFKVFFNAELPGSFVSCLHHFFKTRYPKRKLEWTASSLFEGTTYLDDRYGLVKKYPEKWLINEHFKGDVTLFSNLKYIENYFNSPDTLVDLYTSDIGVGVNEDIAPQEESNFFANLGQIYSGLVSLKEGGTLLIKTYTFFEPYSEGLFELLFEVFDNIKIIKPSLSSKFNSEVYVLGFGYKRKDFYKSPKDLKNQFEKYTERNLENKSLFEKYNTVTEPVVNSLLKKASEFYFLKQAQNLADFKLVITNYGKLMVNIKDFAKYFEMKSDEYTQEWLQKYPIVICEEEERTEGSEDFESSEQLEIIENFKTKEDKEYIVQSLDSKSTVATFKVNLNNKYIDEKVSKNPVLKSFYENKKSIYIYDGVVKQKNLCNQITSVIIRYFEKDIDRSSFDRSSFDKSSFNRSSLHKSPFDRRDFYSIIFEITDEKCFVDTLVKSFSFKRIFEKSKKEEYYELII